MGLFRYLLTIVLMFNIAFASSTTTPLNEAIQKTADIYNDAVINYQKKGPLAFFESTPQLNLQDKKYFESLLSKLPQLPQVIADNVAFILKDDQQSFRIKIVVDHTINLILPNGQKISLTPKRSLETISMEISKGLFPQVSSSFLIPSAHAVSVFASLIWGAVGGGIMFWLYNMFFKAKPKTTLPGTNGYVYQTPTHFGGGGGGEAVADPKNNNNTTANANGNSGNNSNNSASQSQAGGQANAPAANGSTNGSPASSITTTQISPKIRDLLKELFCQQNPQTPPVLENFFVKVGTNTAATVGDILAQQYNSLKDQNNLASSAKLSRMKEFYKIFLNQEAPDAGIYADFITASNRTLRKVVENNVVKVHISNPSNITLFCELSNETPPKCANEKIAYKLDDQPPESKARPLCVNAPAKAPQGMQGQLAPAQPPKPVIPFRPPLGGAPTDGSATPKPPENKPANP